MFDLFIYFHVFFFIKNLKLYIDCFSILMCVCVDINRKYVKKKKNKCLSNQ